MDRPSAHVEQGRVADGVEDGKRASLLGEPDLAVIHPCLIEARGVLLDARSRHEHALLADQWDLEPLLPLLPGAARAHGERGELRPVVAVAEDAGLPGRLARARSGGLEAADLEPTVLPGHGGREADDSRSHHREVELG